MAIFKTCYWVVSLMLSGVIATFLTIPLLASWFGIQLTITGSSTVVGMYMYLLTSIVVGLGLLVGLAAVAAVIVLVAWGGYEGYQLYTRRKVAKIKAYLLKK